MIEITEANIENYREKLPRDQADELVVGCLTHSFDQPNTPEKGVLTIYPESYRGAVCFGADSEWGDLDIENEVIVLDNGILVDFDGNHYKNFVETNTYRFAVLSCPEQKTYIIQSLPSGNYNFSCFGTPEEAVQEALSEFYDSNYEGSLEEATEEALESLTEYSPEEILGLGKSEDSWVYEMGLVRFI